MPERKYDTFTARVRQRGFNRPDFTVQVKGGTISSDAEATAHVLRTHPDLEASGVPATAAIPQAPPLDIPAPIPASAGVPAAG